MILECDIGNSRCKWRLQNGLRSGVFDYRKEGFSFFENLESVTEVRVCVVAGIEIATEFETVIADLFGCQTYFAKTAASCGGVHCAYENVSGLGVDRWSAMVAAFHRFDGAVLVVDAGSALTIDLVEASGWHLGGYIIPGHKLMCEALLKETAAVRFDGVFEQPGFGKSTQQCVAAGVVTSLVGAIQLSIQQAAERTNNNFSVVLTGGDAELLAPFLDYEVEVVPELVLDGLSWLLPERS